MKNSFRSKTICIICTLIFLFASLPVWAAEDPTLTWSEMSNSEAIHEGDSIHPGARQSVAYYWLRVEHEGYYTISADSTSCDTVLYLYDTDGVFVCMNDDSVGTNSRISQYLEADSEYYIKATSTGGGALRNYTVSVNAIWYDKLVTYNGSTINYIDEAPDIYCDTDFTLSLDIHDTVHSQSQKDNITVTWSYDEDKDGRYTYKNPIPGADSVSLTSTADYNFGRYRVYHVDVTYPDGFNIRTSFGVYFFISLRPFTDSPDSFNYLTREGEDIHVHYDVTSPIDDGPLGSPQVGRWNVLKDLFNLISVSDTSDIVIHPEENGHHICNSVNVIDVIGGSARYHYYKGFVNCLFTFILYEDELVGLEPDRTYTLSDYISEGTKNYINNQLIFSFIPDISGTYVITSSGGRIEESEGHTYLVSDPYVALFDSDLHCIGSNDNAGAGNQATYSRVSDDVSFSLSSELEAGRTYYYAIPINTSFWGHPFCDGETTVRLSYQAPGSPNENSNNNTNNNVEQSEPVVPTPTPAIPTRSPSAPAVSREGGVAGFVERLYTEALERPSDPVGKQDWIDAITLRGETGAGCARGFLYSPEFLNKECTDEEFVAVLYRTFFDREPDQAGFNAWVGVLRNGTPKEEIIEGFINSAEWANLCLFYGIRSGGTGVPTIEMEPNALTIGFATRLYTTCLGRSADQNGLMAWARQLANQRDTGTGAAHGFFSSDEFLRQNVSNDEYVTRLYRTFMDREPDQAGYDAWVAQLNSGVSREAVFNGFAQSPEFARICASYGIVR